MDYPVGLRQAIQPVLSLHTQTHIQTTLRDAGMAEMGGRDCNGGTRLCARSLDLTRTSKPTTGFMSSGWLMTCGFVWRAFSEQGRETFSPTVVRLSSIAVVFTLNTKV